MSDYKKQHYIPEFYLKAWCDPSSPQDYEPYLWIASKDGSNIKPKAPSNIFHETDLYTIKIDGKRDLSIEKNLAQIEGEFSDIRRNKLEKHLMLNIQDKIIICAFAAAMYSRTLANGERWKPIWNDVANQTADIMRKFTEWRENATPEQLESYIPSMSSKDSSVITYEEIKEVADEPLKLLIPTQFKILIPLFLKLDLAIIETSTSPGFITSDDPCVWFDSQLPNYSRLAGRALISPTIEIHLPISPSQCIFLSRRGEKGYINLSNFGPLREIKSVTEVNWRTRMKSNKYFIVNKKIILAKWFTFYQS
ncbi:MAG: DUF4238 domain-containing protein [Anaerolineales bacterium]|nr:DUF4238 domain-containing protein [Anaerolineales bacterium]